MKKLINYSLILQLMVGPAMAQTLNETFDATSVTAKGLTDQEQNAANNYYHEGAAERLLEEQCKKLKTGCNDSSGRPGNVLGGFEEVLPKLYAIMGTLAAAGVGGKIKMNPVRPAANAPATPPPAAGAQPEQRTKTDVCIYIPIAGEAISTFTQQQAEQQIQQQNIDNQRDMQREALYAVARTQNTRAKTSKMQASIYAATGACYVAYMAMGASLKDPMLWVKMGAATAMSAIFFKKAANHKKYANQLKEIADKLPGLGECNPFTSTNCFCSEKTSSTSDPSNFNRFCVPKTIANNGPPGTQVACATLNSAGQAVVDAACQCRQTNSCANAQIRSLSGQLGLGGIGFNDALSILDNSVGTFEDATLGNSAENLNASNTRALAGSNGVVPDLNNTGKNKEISDKIASLGIPAGVSDALAGQSDGALPAALATAPVSSSETTNGNATGARAQVPGYNAANGARGAGGNGEAEFVNPLSGLADKGQKPSAIQIDTYAEQALRGADVTNDPSASLFDIITNRFRKNGWGQAANNPAP